VPTVAETLPEPPCGVCGRRDWHGGGEEKPMRLGEQGPPHIAVVWFVCNHCGYLRFHTPRLFRDAEDG
jgi:hypothetical protein